MWSRVARSGPDSEAAPLLPAELLPSPMWGGLRACSGLGPGECPMRPASPGPQPSLLSRHAEVREHLWAVVFVPATSALHQARPHIFLSFIPPRTLTVIAVSCEETPFRAPGLCTWLGWGGTARLHPHSIC